MFVFITKQLRKIMSLKDLPKVATFIVISLTAAQADPSVVLPSDADMTCALDQASFDIEWTKLAFGSSLSRG
ncbi:hypothetical protein [Pseudophaeobacter leonis]|uniref:hypothetical protein n=1 Tax=Pseudophaeobacter leonis TaxID=1144477 RepID=UPI0009F337FF|nr:hypothetical protein [Pseudophaeobacter leonis]